MTYQAVITYLYRTLHGTTGYEPIRAFSTSIGVISVWEQRPPEAFVFQAGRRAFSGLLDPFPGFPPWVCV